MVWKIRVWLVVCKIMIEESDDKSKHEVWYEDVGWTLEKETLFGIGGFRFRFSSLILSYSTTTEDFETASTLVRSCHVALIWILSSCFEYNITVLFPILHRFDPISYRWPVKAPQWSWSWAQWWQLEWGWFTYHWIIILLGFFYTLTVSLSTAHIPDAHSLGTGAHCRLAEGATTYWDKHQQ